MAGFVGLMRQIFWRLVLACICFGGLLAVSGCGETHSWRQKTILEIETPNGVVSGGSVVEVTVRWFGSIESMLTGGGAVSSGAIGEASFVEAAPGKFLFALSVTEPMERTLEAFRSSPKETNRELTARLATASESGVLPASLYPKLVTFADINDPKTVQLVDPANLAATFGSGFALREIRIEITDEKVTVGTIGKVLGWLPLFNNLQLDGNRYRDLQNSSTANSLSSGDFATGELQ
jgi:hypothetical protein